MGIRFGKSIRLGKYFRINISTQGIGFSVGGRGLTFSSGPRGQRVTAGIPGTGLSYVKHLGGGRSSGGSRRRRSEPAAAPEAPPEPRQDALPKPPTPGLFASTVEREFYAAIEALDSGDRSGALTHFLEAREEPSAAIMAAALLSHMPAHVEQAIDALEDVLASDVEFPTELMKKYIPDATIDVDVTGEIRASVPVGTFGAALLLAELYQQRQQHDAAIGVLEELDEALDEPLLTLSLCDLYADAEIWEGVLACLETVEVVDDVTLELAILRARAFQAKGVHDAAIMALTAALKKKKDRDPGLLNEALYWRAVSYEATGKRSQAKKEFMKIFAASPSFRDVAARLGV
jgi:tetratricopeptide (TPR) repeat protein